MVVTPEAARVWGLPPAIELATTLHNRALWPFGRWRGLPSRIERPNCHNAGCAYVGRHTPPGNSAADERPDSVPADFASRSRRG